MNGTLLLALLPETYEETEVVIADPHGASRCAQGCSNEGMCLPGPIYSPS